MPVKVKSIRGKFNVPRQRFHVRGKTEYLWAGPAPLFWGRLGLPIVAVTLGANEAVDACG